MKQHHMFADGERIPAKVNDGRPAADATLGSSPRNVLTPTEAAKLIGRSRSWVHARIADGTLPHVRIGTRVFLKLRELIDSGWVAA